MADMHNRSCNPYGQGAFFFQCSQLQWNTFFGGISYLFWCDKTGVSTYCE